MLDTKENFEKMMIKLNKRLEELGITEEDIESDDCFETPPAKDTQVDK